MIPIIMNKRIFLFLIVLQFVLLPLTGQVVCGPNDSVRVEALLKEGLAQPASTNLELFYAKKFLDFPYVAHTLEKGDPERLVVNLDELDCTTYVDVVAALVRTVRAKHSDWSTFCLKLRQQRYPNGVIKNYTSRNHYYSQWIAGGESEGFSHEINSADCKNSFNPFQAKQVLKLSFMSTNPTYYDALKRHPEYVKDIAKMEKKMTGKTVSYIPNRFLNLGKDKLRCVHDGDILALVTSKDGLDVSHLGFAVWMPDGKLHLLNASSLYHKVVLDQNTLYTYMKRQKTNLGIRVIRLK